MLTFNILFFILSLASLGPWLTFSATRFYFPRSRFSSLSLTLAFCIAPAPLRSLPPSPNNLLFFRSLFPSLSLEQLLATSHASLPISSCSADYFYQPVRSLFYFYRSQKENFNAISNYIKFSFSIFIVCRVSLLALRFILFVAAIVVFSSFHQFYKPFFFSFTSLFFIAFLYLFSCIVSCN